MAPIRAVAVSDGGQWNVVRAHRQPQALMECNEGEPFLLCEIQASCTVAPSAHSEIAAGGTLRDWQLPKCATRIDSECGPQPDQAGLSSPRICELVPDWSGRIEL